MKNFPANQNMTPAFQLPLYSPRGYRQLRPMPSSCSKAPSNFVKLEADRSSGFMISLETSRVELNINRQAKCPLMRMAVSALI